MKKRNKFFLNRNSICTKYSNIILGISFDIKKRMNDNIGIIHIYDQNFIGYTIKNSLDKHLKKLLELLLKVEEGDEDPPATLLFCLDETDRLRKQFINKYERFLEKKQKDFFEKKIEIIQKDIKNKLIAYRLSSLTMYNHQNNYYEEEEERHHTR